MKRMIILAVITALLAVSYPTDLSTASRNHPGGVLWMTYKYDQARTGYFDVSRLNPPPTGGLLDAEVEWTATAQLCIASSPAIGDVNGDGVYEVVYNSCDGYLYVVEAGNGSVLFKVRTGGEFASPTLWDIDGDGLPEILTGGGGGALMAINGDGGTIWEIRDRMFSGSPGVGDFNGDGRYEVAMGSSDGHLYIADAGNGTVISRLKLGDGEASTPSIADVDGDGLPEIVIVESSNLHVIDYQAGQGFIDHVVGLKGLLVPSPPIYDLYGDGMLDAVVDNRDGGVFIVNLVNGSIMAEAQLPGVTDSASPASIGDVDGDGAPDIVIATMQGLFVLDDQLNIKYSVPELQVYTSSPIISDIDLDGRNEVLIGLEDGEFMIINASDPRGYPYNIEYDYQTNGPVMGSAAIADTDGDHLPEIFIGSRDYNMYCFKPVYMEPATTTTPSNTTTTTTTPHTTLNPTRTTTTTPQRTTTISKITNTSHSIVIPTTKPRKGLMVNTGLIAAALIGSLIVIALTLYYTRR